LAQLDFNPLGQGAEAAGEQAAKNLAFVLGNTLLDALFFADQDPLLDSELFTFGSVMLCKAHEFTSFVDIGRPVLSLFLVAQVGMVIDEVDEYRPAVRVTLPASELQQIHIPARRFSSAYR
jgi:hypothetical protein